MKKFLKFAPILFILAFMPLIVSAFAPAPGASSCSGATGIAGMLCTIAKLLNLVVPILVSLGVVYFVWGVVNYVIADGEEAKKKGKDSMIYGIIGLAVIVSLWGLVTMVTTTFGLDASAPTVDLASSGNTCTGSLKSSPKLGDVFDYATCFVGRYIIPLIFALAVATFVWGVVQFVINTDEEAKKAKGKQFMLWGIIALAVMISVWGLVGIVGKTFGLNTSVLPSVAP